MEERNAVKGSEITIETSHLNINILEFRGPFDQTYVQKDYILRETSDMLGRAVVLFVRGLGNTGLLLS